MSCASWCDVEVGGRLPCSADYIGEYIRAIEPQNENAKETGVARIDCLPRRLCLAIFYH